MPSKFVYSEYFTWWNPAVDDLLGCLLPLCIVLGLCCSTNGHFTSSYCRVVSPRIAGPLSSHQLMDACVALAFEYYRQGWVEQSMYRCLWGYFSILSGICLGIQLLSYRIFVFSILRICQAVFMLIVSFANLCMRALAFWGSYAVSFQTGDFIRYEMAFDCSFD